MTACAKAGLAFGSGQAFGNAFTFLVLMACVVLASLWIYKRLIR